MYSVSALEDLFHGHIENPKRPRIAVTPRFPDGEITIFSDAPSFPVRGDTLAFEPRFADFKWGDYGTGDLICREGYKIRVSAIGDSWVVLCGPRRLGEYRDLRAAIGRAERHRLLNG